MLISKTIGPALFAAAISFGCLVVFKTNIEPWQGFNPQVNEYSFARDAVSGELPPVPSDFFSAENVERYHKGDGFTATFTVTNDPHKNFGTTEEKCGVEKWGGSYGEMLNPVRRELVIRRQAEFKECVSRFVATLAILQSVEIGLDDTEGVDKKLRDFVVLNLERSLGNPEDFLMSGAATRLTTRLVFFRISKSPVLQRLVLEIRPGASRKEAKEVFERGLKWLLTTSAAKEKTALAENLVSVFKENADIALRRIVIVSNGMSNPPFYRVLHEPRFLDRSNYEVLDKSLKSLKEIPDLWRARITWFVPPSNRRFQAAAKYWEHVLKDKARAEVEVIY